jgi:hypothetical protein
MTKTPREKLGWSTSERKPRIDVAWRPRQEGRALCAE